MLTTQNKPTATAYDFEQNRDKIEKMLTGFEYNRHFKHIICINIACFYAYSSNILTELEFFRGSEKKEILIIFYEEMDDEEKYDGDRQVQFLKENGLYGISNCLYLCLGVPVSQSIEVSIKNALKKAHFID